MADTVSKKKRSEIMSKVESKDSKIEVEFRKAIWKAGFRYSKNKNPTKYFGKPDLVLKNIKLLYLLIPVSGTVANGIAVYQQQGKNTGRKR